MNRRVLEKLAVIGLIAIDASRNHQFLALTEDTKRQSEAMGQIVVALRAAGLAPADIDNARAELYYAVLAAKERTDARFGCPIEGFRGEDE